MFSSWGVWGIMVLSIAPIGMSLLSGETITLQGKTYNISQINSVYTGSVNKISPGKIFLLWLLGGFISALLLGSLPKSIPNDVSVPLWIIATLAASIYALIVSSKKDYAVFFDMSSGKVAAYSNQDQQKVEKIKNDIVEGIEKKGLTTSQ
jgi:hypothetical protein